MDWREVTTSLSMIRVLIVGHHRILLLLIGMCGMSGGLWQKSNRGEEIRLDVIASLWGEGVGGKSNSWF